MYRLLIVDDEEIIADGLYEFFGNMLELELDVYKAYSGEEAIEWLRRTRIDIVLTDIHMPGIDGLELMDTIRKNWPACRIIFLTGYDDFNYVYRAIQQPGVRYILKSEDYDRVIETVRSQVEDIRRTLRTEDLISQAQKEMHAARELLMNDYFGRLMHGDPSTSATCVQFQRLGVQMRADRPLMLLLVRPDAPPENAPYSDKVQRQYAVRLVLRKYLSERVASVLLSSGADDIAMLIQPREAGGTEAEETLLFEDALTFLKGTLELVQAACRASADTAVSLVLSERPFPWAELPVKYLELHRLLGRLSAAGSETFLTDAEFEGDVFGGGKTAVALEDGPDARALEALLRRSGHEALDMYLESGQEQLFLEKLSEYTSLLRACRSRNSGLAIEAYALVALRLLAYINRRKLTETLAFHIGQNQLMRFDSFASWKEAADYLESLSRLLFALQKEETLRRMDNAAEYIQRYVTAHLGEDLSLVRLAEKVYLNPCYLSRLFKQATGHNLSEYIESARVKRAREMLIHENVKVQDVARAVGYDTATSFTRFFRKATGVSPQEYRVIHLSAQSRTDQQV